MLMTFHSKNSGSIIIDRDIGVTLLKLAGHSGTVPGAILAAGIPAAMDRLVAGLDRSAPAQTIPPASPQRDDPDEPPPVSLRLRAFPLIEMLKVAARHNADVHWENGAGVI